MNLKLRILVGVVTIAGASALVTNQVISQDKNKPKAGGEGMRDPAEMARMMAEYMKLSQPGEHHKHLNQFVGKWKLKTKMWMAGPDAPPSVSEGTATVKWIMGGRYLTEEVTSEMDMGPMGKQPFEGFGLTGYDNVRNLYTNCWIDSMGTQMMISKGTRHPGTGLYTYYGEMDEPSLKMYGRAVKWVVRVINDDKHVGEMYDLAVADDYKVFEIEYERIK